MPNFNVLDFIFLFIAVFLIIKATIRGFIDELFSTIGVLVSFIIATLFYKVAAKFLLAFFNFEKLQYVIAFLLLFLVSYIIIKIIQYFISGILISKTISSLNHALGFFLGLLKALIIIFIIIFVIANQKFISPEKILEESIITSFVLGLYNIIFS
ncbi:MAG: CvpA family protein [Treponemataceae bacterium]